MPVRLYHFSDDPSIEVLIPRPVRVPSPRRPGLEWLNGPLVWAIDEAHQPMYLFPRGCPRILVWPTQASTEEDVRAHFGDSGARMIAYMEERWMERMKVAILYRYQLPAVSFRSLNDAGMWVSESRVEPCERAEIVDLSERLREQGVELRILPSLLPLRDVWETSLHASGIRLRNATGWT